MITLYRTHFAISGKNSDAHLMRHPDDKTFHFVAEFAQHGYEHVVFENEHAMINILDVVYNRQHFIYDDQVFYLEGTIYAQYFATIEGI